jgi:NADPH-dependent stearoyl-CoA 9-desaturase
MSANMEPASDVGLLALKNNPELFKEFSKAIDEIHKRHKANLGTEDLAFLEEWYRTKQTQKWLGRILAGTCIDPITFCLSIHCLVAYKLKDSLNHMVLHGCYDHPAIQKHRGSYNIPDELHSKELTRWGYFSMDIEGWKKNHGNHHYHTNILHSDADTTFSYLRMEKEIPWVYTNLTQLPLTVIVLSLFDEFMGAQHAGVWTRDFLPLIYPESSLEKGYGIQRPTSHKRGFFRSILRKWGTELIAIPALSGVLAPRVFMINVLSNLICSWLLGLYIYQGHHVSETKIFEDKEDANIRGKSGMYLHQILTSNNFYSENSWWNHFYESTSCGLEHQTEHHLFPKMPHNRLKEMAPEVEQVCKDFGVPYNKKPFLKGVLDVFKRVTRHSLP